MGKVNVLINKINTECACVLEALEQAYNYSESGISTRIGELKTIKNAPHNKDMSSFELMAIDQMYDFAIPFYEDIVRNVVRGSFVVMTCGSIETMLKRIVLSMDDKDVPKEIKSSLAKAKGRVAETAKEIISSIDNCEIPIFFDSEFKMISEIRNAYAHDSGIADEDRKLEIESLCNLLDGQATGRAFFDFEELENGLYKIKLYSTFVGFLIARCEESIAELLENLLKSLNKKGKGSEPK